MNPLLLCYRKWNDHMVIPFPVFSVYFLARQEYAIRTVPYAKHVLFHSYQYTFWGYYSSFILLQYT